MKIYAISDLHISTNTNKPMDIFGGNWVGYLDKIFEDWQSKVTDDDIVLIGGDISWAMRLEETKTDLEWIHNLPGKKIIIKGNHEYWWKSISAVREVLPDSMMAIQNDSIKIGDYIICGTRGWTVPEENKEFLPEDEKIYKREVERLKLTLKSAKVLQENNEKIICMMHFPPLTDACRDTGFVDLLERFGVADVVYGHLHGAGLRTAFRGEHRGVRFHLVSCDGLDFKVYRLNGAI